MISSKLKTSQSTILIFDSGVGGLSVYNKVRQVLPNLHYIYVFDNDAFPYGEKSAKFIVERVFHIFDKIQQKHLLTIAIIACNTVSIVGLSMLRRHFKFPIIGVVPAIKTATKLTCNGIIGLLATKATISGKYTRDLIKKFAINCKVEMLASPELVELAEKKIHGDLISKKELICIVKPWLKMKKPPDTIVLGCTHFTLLIAELKEILFDGIKIIDSNTEVAKQVFRFINNHQNLVLTKNNNIAYCTRKNAKIEKLAYVLISEGFNQLEKISI